MTEIAHGASKADDHFTAPAAAPDIDLANPLGFLCTGGLHFSRQPEQGEAAEPRQLEAVQRHQKLLLVTL